MLVLTAPLTFIFVFDDAPSVVAQPLNMAISRKAAADRKLVFMDSFVIRNQRLCKLLRVERLQIVRLTQDMPSQEVVFIVGMVIRDSNCRVRDQGSSHGDFVREDFPQVFCQVL